MSTIQLRVQLAEAWDAVTVDADPSEPVRDVKLRALGVLDRSADMPEAYSVAWRGEQVLDESASLAEAGVLDKGTLLIARRRRRPVR